LPSGLIAIRQTKIFEDYTLQSVIKNPPKNVTIEQVLRVNHWTETLFSFRTTRPAAFRFRSGEFIMLGLLQNEKPLLRAYSIASPHWDDGLDFYSIKVQDGPLTSLLQHIRPEDKILIGKKPTGTLVTDNLKPAQRIFLFSTGTGVAPFSSLVRDPELYEKYEQIILTHTCRKVEELKFSQALVNDLRNDPLVGDLAQSRIKYFASCTRDSFMNIGRITDQITSESFFKELSIDPLNPNTDVVMICGSMQMINDTCEILENLGFEEGSNSKPASYVIEKAFAD